MVMGYDEANESNESKFSITMIENFVGNFIFSIGSFFKKHSLTCTNLSFTLKGLSGKYVLLNNEL